MSALSMSMDDDDDFDSVVSAPPRRTAFQHNISDDEDEFESVASSTSRTALRGTRRDSPRGASRSQSNNRDKSPEPPQTPNKLDEENSGHTTYAEHEDEENYESSLMPSGRASDDVRHSLRSGKGPPLRHSAEDEEDEEDVESEHLSIAPFDKSSYTGTLSPKAKKAVYWSALLLFFAFGMTAVFGVAKFTYNSIAVLADPIDSGIQLHPAEVELSAGPDERRPPPRPPPALPPPPPPPSQLTLLSYSPPLPVSPPSPTPSSPPPVSPPPLPPPGKPPLSPPPLLLIGELNARFLKGSPSKSLKSAGVLLHQLNYVSSTESPWKKCEPGSACYAHDDRWATSIVNKDARVLKYTSYGGFVMEPEIANAFCSYPYDGNQRNFNCVPPGKSDQCTPGCRSSWCTHTRDWECSFPGDDLKSMLEAQSERHSGDHNEVILDASHIRENLPNAMKAMFYVSTSSDIEISRIKKVHGNWLKEWSVSAAAFPLVMLDLDATTKPFTEVIY